MTNNSVDETPWRRPDIPMKCPYKSGDLFVDSPHHHETNTRKKLAGNILEVIGNTPLVRLNNITRQEGIECELYAKCEFMNPGGSVKDRIGRRMVEEAEREGLLKQGDTLIEPTSGNTGIGLGMTAAVKGYRCIITMPDKMSKEKEFLLRGLGTEIIRTPTNVDFDHHDSYLLVADRLRRSIGSSAHTLNQYANPYNPVEHFDHIAEEIIEDCTESNGIVKLDAVVCGLGTGGTYTGLLHKIKLKVPSCPVIGVDPVGSMLYSGKHSDVHAYHVEGVGYDFYPTVMEKPAPGNFFQVDDKESFTMARRLLREEGLLCGGSSGLNLAGAIKAIKSFGWGKGKRVVVILPDSIRNYMTKHLSDSWMYSRGFLDLPENVQFTKPWKMQNLEEIKSSLKPVVSVSEERPIREVLKVMKMNEQTVALVTDVHKESVRGVFDADVYFSLVTGSIGLDDKVGKAINRNTKTLTIDDTLQTAGSVLADEPYVVILDKQSPFILRKVDMLWWTSMQNV